jgi:phosphatidylserine/phosphatidylglycerophosphate/cardiolipin synthase-like enzyme
MRLLAKYSNDEKLDARFIFRNIGPMRKKLESLQIAGFNMSKVRMQAGCHTKGIIIDSEKILLGSHNFTNQGVQVNRDASLLLRHKGIAQYYERIFLHDWEKLSRATIREEATPVPVGLGHEGFAEDDRVRVPWSYYVED